MKTPFPFFARSRTAGIVIPGLLLLLVTVLPSSVVGQDLRMVGGNITLTVTTGTAGGTLNPVIDASSSIRYKEAAVPTKITVQTVCPGQKFNLTVVATAIGVGTAAPAVPLMNGMLPTDLVTNIGAGSKKTFTLTLQYTASATFAQGNSSELGNDNHTITYSLVAQ